MTEHTKLRQAAEAIATADAMLIGAGAGMGVDSGLLDFRGSQGFWNAYLPYAKLGLSFSAVANPQWFATDPGLAWGFYGHRMNLYRATRPHEGFQILQRWAQRMKHGAFAFTSNVDGHSQRAGFDAERVVEIHGAIDWMQCARGCGAGPYPAAGVLVVVDEETTRAGEPYPACPQCGAMARPNILMFGDWGWDGARTGEQLRRLELWLGSACDDKVVIIECGAGMAIPTVRHFCEQQAVATSGLLVRFNPREPDVPDGQIGLAMGALEGLRAIDQLL
jgi:NAD-dependent SIR2 family protein deacetylase